MLNSKNKILFLGPTGSYTENALKKFIDYFNLECEIEPVSTIKKIIQDVSANNCLAVVPIENSIEGIVRETVDALLNVKGVRIFSQIVLPISHCLISKGTKDKIKTILSHPQALNQCQSYIASEFGKSINIITTSSTSFATRSLLELDETHASIGNEYCADFYNLNIIDKNINDIKDNRTRFVLIGNVDENKDATRTSIAFSTKNQPGALLKVLEVFKKYDLNLIYIESRPSKEVIGDYVFFADIDRGLNLIQDALSEIACLCSFCKILGSYSVIKH